MSKKKEDPKKKVPPVKDPQAEKSKPVKRIPTLIIGAHPRMTYFVGHIYDLTPSARAQAEKWGIAADPPKTKK